MYPQRQLGTRAGVYRCGRRESAASSIPSTKQFAGGRENDGDGNGKRRWYDRREAAPDPGASVVLTIDETIQYIAEKELTRAIEDTHAKAGAVVVQIQQRRIAGGGQLADV